MEFKEHNLITRIWIFCHSEYDHVCFDHPSSETCAKHSVGVEEFSSCIVVPALRNLWLFLVFNNVLISLTLYFCLYIKDKSAELRKKGRKERKNLWYKIVSTETVRFVLKRFFRKIRMSFWFSVKESDPRYDLLCLSILRATCKQTQQLTTILGGAGQQCCIRLNKAKSLTGFKLCLTTAQQHTTTCNRVCKPTQHVTSNNVGTCWPTMPCKGLSEIYNHWYQARQQNGKLAVVSCVKISRKYQFKNSTGLHVCEDKTAQIQSLAKK